MLQQHLEGPLADRVQLVAGTLRPCKQAADLCLAYKCMVKYNRGAKYVGIPQPFGSSGCSFVPAHQPPKSSYFARCLVCQGRREEGFRVKASDEEGPADSTGSYLVFLLAQDPTKVGSSLQAFIKEEI